MNYSKWIAHFERNRRDRPEPEWSAPQIPIPAEALAPLVRSLEQFQLGDGGGPASLIAFDAERYRSCTEETRTLVDLWFAEEKEHARLLSCAVDRFGGRRIKSHWSFTAFCLCRRVSGVRFELQVLLLTELVSTAYYRVLRRHSPDAPLAAMCALILRDEAGHVAFHRDRLASAGRSPLGLGGALWQTQFWVFGHAAASVLWASHGRCLTAIGGSRAEYFQEVRRQLRQFVLSLCRAVEPLIRARDPVCQPRRQPLTSI
ncbi:MAG TPA: ferritin-like domain-containing protein [Verrucomicrobiae bacterium]|nr:ferritin-like domain-containing protein [Verrucomicrobiae bacterium]